MRTLLSLCLVSSVAWAADGAAKLPPGVSPGLYALAVKPVGGPPPANEVQLGEKLFRDKRLSINDTVACATCHVPEEGFVDHKSLSDGVNGKTGRNSPTVLNAMFNATQFWDGRAQMLEDQAKLPILNPVEMGQPSGDAVVTKLKKIPEYVTLFQQVFGKEITYDAVSAAISAFERTQYSANAPFDRFIAGDDKALSSAAKRGWMLFNGKGRCNSCHAGNTVNFIFSDQKFHNIGIAAHKANFADLARDAVRIVRAGDEKQIDELAIGSKYTEVGRFLVTRREADIGAFKTPTLRNIAITGPYMHDGSMATLWDVMDHYNKGGVPNPFLDGGMQRLGLSESEIDDVIAFLESLTDDRFAAFAKKEMSRQRGQKSKRPERDTAAAMAKRGDLGDLAPSPDLKNPARMGVY